MVARSGEKGPGSEKPRMGRGCLPRTPTQGRAQREHSTMKIKCEFGGGGDTILFAPKSQEFFSYEKDSAFLHTRFGGKAYYSSRSGLSGEGYLCPPPSDPLLEVGSYRTDAHLSPHPALSPLYGGIQCFVPYRSHKGIDGNKPIVLEGVGKVAMVAEFCRVWETIAAWGDEEKWRKIEIPAYTNYGSLDPIHLQIQGHGVSVLPFIDHPRITEARGWVNTINSGEYLHTRDWPLRAIGWYPAQPSGDGWLHQAKDGHFDAYSPDIHPLDMEGELPGGWVVDPDEFFFWQVRQREVYGFLWDFGGDGELPVEYEISVSIVEFFALGSPHWIEECKAGIAWKRQAQAAYEASQAAGRLAWAAQKEEVKALLVAHPDLEFSLADCAAQGFCQPGTLAWLKSHGVIPSALTETRTAKQLMSLPTAEQMIEDRRFHQVVRAKVAALHPQV